MISHQDTKTQRRKTNLFLVPSCLRGRSYPAEAGFSFLELIISMSIITIVLVAGIQFITTSQNVMVMNEDHAFAIQKAISMVNELRAYADGHESTGGAQVLDVFDDGIGTSPFLTIDQTIADPADIISGNKWLSNRWRYARRITVRKFPSFQASNVRIVTVKIFLTEPGSNDRSIMADISSVVTTLGDTAPPTQVYDIYLLCLENIPGWWVYLAYLKPFIENALSDMQSRNPGMEYRQHWITKSAYGRDQEYQPFFNDAVDSNQNINYVYFYPGTMPSGSAATQYYVPSNVKARVNIDGTTTNNYHATNNPYPYTLADQYNHAMRYPAEAALYQQRVAAGTEQVDTPTYRLLLDDMVLNPGKYRNSLFINLHGELLPMPSIRNYSDAAKDPDTYSQWRIVTHPENLRYGLAENLKLRVYAYLADPSIAGNNLMTVPISIVIPQVNLTTAGDITIDAIKGGITPQYPTITYSVISPAPDTPTGTQMYATVNYDADDDYTIIRLYNTPLRTPEVTGNGGLDTTRRLYNMDYIPCPVSGTNFSLNLTSTLADKPKNTARWVITISQTAVDREFGTTGRVIGFQTRINDDVTTGVMWPTLLRNKPADVSTTYIWRNDSANAVPFSERYQFQGDPRHCPYADVKANHGYNWYFDNFKDGTNDVVSEWSGFDATRIGNSGSGTGNDTDGWHGAGGFSGDMMEIDVPRFFQFIRTALTGANCAWTSITGWSYYYMGLGNEIGYDSANGFTNSIPVSKKPFDGSTGSRNEQSITTDLSGGVKYIRENVTPYWWGMPWLGELYPDDVYSTQWSLSGNLNSGSGASKFVRILRHEIRTSGGTPAAKFLNRGTKFYRPSSGDNLKCVRRTNQYGCTSFFNSGTSASTYNHAGRDGTTGNITVDGLLIANSYNFPLPGNASISRPFRLNNNWGAVPTEFNISDYSTVPTRCAIAQISKFYDHQDGTNWAGSSLLRLDNGGSNAFMAVNGLDKTVESGSAFIARYAVLSLMHSFLSCGLTGTPSRIVQLPRIEIKTPNVTTEINNPVTIPITWEITWTRWDKLKYTTAYPAGFTETESDLKYALLYSSDNGVSWKHIIDNSAATPGIPNQSLWLNDLTTEENETYNWDVSNTGYFIEGSYVVMVEAYRNSQTCHYSYHQQKIFINR
ncbi:MAG: hypothetical protein V1871_01985 [Planctomycetota bacterium]